MRMSRVVRDRVPRLKLVGITVHFHRERPLDDDPVLIAAMMERPIGTFTAWPVFVQGNFETPYPVVTKDSPRTPSEVA